MQIVIYIGNSCQLGKVMAQEHLVNFLKKKQMFAFN